MRSEDSGQGFFSLQAVLGAVLGAILLGIASAIFLQEILGASGTWQNHRTLILTVIGLFWVNLLLLWRRPHYLRLSRWIVDAKDLVLALVVGYSTQVLTFLLWPRPESSPDWVQIVCLVVVIPPLEEMFARGILLRSLLSVWPPWLSIATITILQAVMHFRFLPALLPQLAFCVLYYQRRNCITASIICHSMTNAVVLFSSLNLLTRGSIGLK